MSVNIGQVATFADVRPDKEQALKPLEEAAEVFSAWQILDDVMQHSHNPLNDDLVFSFSRRELVNECCDLIQATCNLLASCGVSDISEEMEECKARNMGRGRRYEVQTA